MIFSKQQDPRLVTVRRGGTLQDADHHRLALWAADCAEHVLHYFEHVRPSDDRPRRAIDLARAWARDEMTMTQARTAAFGNAAAREVSGAAKLAALAAGQAVAVSHVPAHELAREIPPRLDRRQEPLASQHPTPLGPPHFRRRPCGLASSSSHPAPKHAPSRSRGAAGRHWVARARSSAAHARHNRLPRARGGDDRRPVECRPDARSQAEGPAAY